MDIEGLKKRLRYVASNLRPHSELCKESADAIEQLQLWMDEAGDKALQTAIKYNDAADTVLRLQRELEEARKDAERLNWLDRRMFVSMWNGVIDSGSRTQWNVRGDYRHTAQNMVGATFREAIDAAREKP